MKITYGTIWNVLKMIFKKEKSEKPQAHNPHSALTQALFSLGPPLLLTKCSEHVCAVQRETCHGREQPGRMRRLPSACRPGRVSRPFTAFPECVITPG